MIPSNILTQKGKVILHQQSVNIIFQPPIPNDGFPLGGRQGKRQNPTARKMVPIITCKPWNPVPKQKQDPKAPSDRVNEETLYSTPCNCVKT